MSASVLEKVRRRLIHLVGRTLAPIQLRSRLLVTSDRAGWVIDNVAGSISSRVPGSWRSRVTGDEWLHSQGCLVHLVSRSWLGQGPQRLQQAAAQNALIALWWHGGPSSPDPTLREELEFLGQHRDLFVRVHAPCESSAEALFSVGVEPERVVVLPEGVDTARFAPVDDERRAAIRDRLGIRPGWIAVGCFQKDGVGWGEGREPKLVKGPDILAEALGRIRQQYPICAVIPGASRGFLKARLQEQGVPFIAPGFVAASDIPSFHQCLDLYVSPSLEEGGPAGVLEALAHGTPVVSTRTGVAPDVMVDRREGMIVEVGSAERLAEGMTQLLDDAELMESCREEARTTAGRLDWNALIPEYVEKLYEPALAVGLGRRTF